MITENKVISVFHTEEESRSNLSGIFILAISDKLNVRDVHKSDITGIGTSEAIVQIDVSPVVRTFGMLHGTHSKAWRVMSLVAARVLSVRL